MKNVLTILLISLSFLSYGQKGKDSPELGVLEKKVGIFYLNKLYELDEEKRRSKVKDTLLNNLKGENQLLQSLIEEYKIDSINTQKIINNYKEIINNKDKAIKIEKKKTKKWKIISAGLSILCVLIIV